MDSPGNTSEFSAPWDVGLCQRVAILPLAMKTYPGLP
jgi:hypothetical protein